MSNASFNPNTHPTIPIMMKNMTGFKWVMLNILGHDFMHDFLLSAPRTKKGSVIDGKKKISIVDKVNKTCQSIAKYLKHKKLVKSLEDSMGGGGFFDNPVDNTIDGKKSDDKHDIVERPYDETHDSVGQLDNSSTDKEIDHMEKLILYFDIPDTDLSDFINRDELNSYIDEYFGDLFDTKQSGELVEFNPKIINLLAKGLVQGILSPVIKYVLDIGSDFQLQNKSNNDHAIIPKMMYEIDHVSIFTEPIEGDDIENEDEETTDGVPDDYNENPPPKYTEGVPPFIEGIQTEFAKIFGASVDGSLLKLNREAIKTKKNTIALLKKDSNLDFYLTDAGEEKSATNLEEINETIINGAYDCNSYFSLVKNILLKNYVEELNKSSTRVKTEGVFSLFTHDSKNNTIFNMKPINETINELTTMLNKKFNIDLRDKGIYENDSYDIIGKSLNPIGEFKSLLKIYNISPEDKWKGTPAETPKRQLRNLYLNAMLSVHPDKILQESGSESKSSSSTEASNSNDEVLNNEIASIINAKWELLKSNMGGGGKLKGGAVNTGKLFNAMNTVLNKAIIENSLVLMDCVTGNKDFGYFPSNNNDDSLITTSINSHKGFRPVFQNIFKGVNLQKYLNDNNLLIEENSQIVNIKWNELKNLAGSTSIRKLLASRILLNTQILILFQRCVPSGITTNSLFEGLFLKMDNKGRKTPDLIKRGYLTKKLKGKEQQDPNFVKQFGFNIFTEYENKIKLSRIKFFGKLYDDTLLENNPKWLELANSEDDMLQNSFNQVLEDILPEFIFEMGHQPNIIKTEVDAVAPIPLPPDDGANAYVINNAVPMIYPTLAKAHEDRFGLLNLNGKASRLSQFCPVTSIADSQPLCSIKSKKGFKETQPRALNYSMEMGLEAPISAGVYSYYVDLRKVVPNDDSDYDFYISATLTGPGFLINIGDKTDVLDLKLGPLSAVNTFYEILQNISILTKRHIKSSTSQKFQPRLVLRQFFKENMEILLKAGVKKSIGDYGQEFTALSKYGATNNSIYTEKNLNAVSGTHKTIPYNADGNALRIMVANDRPSAYRGMFILLFADQNTINSRSIVGYYREPKTSGVKSKNSLIAGFNVLKDTGGTKAIKSVTDADAAVPAETAVSAEAKKTGKLKNVLKIKRRSARSAEARPTSKNMTIFMRRFPLIKQWAKDRGIVLKPSNWKKQVRNFARDNPNLSINLNVGGAQQYALMGGNKKKTRKKTRKKERKQKKYKKIKPRKTKKVKKMKRKKTIRKNRKKYKFIRMTKKKK